jgi:dephospho-CoA kinase
MSTRQQQNTETVSHHAVGPITDEEAAPEVPVVDGSKVVEQINEHRDVFVLIGLAGAGKSTVAEMITEEHDERVSHFEVSDFVRTKFEEESEDDVNDNELGVWAAEKKATHGNDYFVREMAETIKAPNAPHIVISGVRSPMEAVAVDEVFDGCTTIGVWTLPDIRFERKYGGQPSEDHDEWGTFQDRNERELWGWGAIEFFARGSMHTADYIIPNHDGLDALRQHVQCVLDGRGQYDENPFPHSDFEKVAQYL